MKDHEQFKNVTAGVQSTVITVAILLGGIWSFYTFSALGSVERAKAELFKQAIVDVEIEAKQEWLANDSSLYIFANVKVMNRGNRNASYMFTGAKLTVTKSGFDQRGASLLGEKIAELPTIGNGVLRIGATRTAPVVVKVPTPGLYYLSFDMPVTEADMQIYRQAGGEGDKPVWSGQTYIIVK
jgi:hypothetical protein